LEEPQLSWVLYSVTAEEQGKNHHLILLIHDQWSRGENLLRLSIPHYAAVSHIQPSCKGRA